MLRSMQEIAFSMKMQTEKMNLISNNIANVNTRGYKKERLNTQSFGEVLIKAMRYNDGSQPNTSVGNLVLGVQAGSPRTVFEQGGLEQTNISTDIGIRGEGFFAVDTPDGVVYTRAGNFRIDQEGYLTTQEGFYVLGENGRLNFQHQSFNVDKKGNIVSQDGYVDRLAIVTFDDLQQMQKIGAGYYTAQNPRAVNQNDQVSVLQKFLEGSNVNIEEETRDMLVSKRNYESGQQIIKMLDDTLGKAVSEIGKI